MKKVFKETDMYAPIKKLLEAQGFIVRGEVKNCDVVGLRNDELWIVEMKLTVNLTLIFQALERQKKTTNVFIAVPRKKNSREKNFVHLKNLLRKIGIGLITVALDSPLVHAEILIFPGSYGKNKNNDLKNELLSRTFDTIGGSTKVPIITAYKEKCIQILCSTKVLGTATGPLLIKHGCDVRANSILNSNHYGWFRKTERGKFILSDVGEKYLSEFGDSPLVLYYMRQISETVI